MKLLKKSLKPTSASVVSPAALPVYDHKKIEPKWQKVWEKKKVNVAKDFGSKAAAKAVPGVPAKKFYGLIEFPFPSGDGLHVGHIRSNTAMDIIARKRRREGYEVLYPIGWDAFGLPTENYAIKTGIQPAIVSKRNSDNFRKQLKALGFSFDWSREVDTSDPAYYRWTQWIFLQLLKKGLAYKKKTLVSWCPKDLTGLANEEVIDGKCERCGTPVEKREKEQWMLAITKYADRLDRDLDTVDFLERIKIQQRNWIGKSEGAELDFDISTDGKKAVDQSIKVFTTRPDTLYGVTYVVLAPEHPLVASLIASGAVKNASAVESYVAAARKKSEMERTSTDGEKTGVELSGVFAIHPLADPKDGKKIHLPIWVADYVLADYGTGAVMAVPAHDERDLAFATAHKLAVKHVVMPHVIDETNPPRPKHVTRTRQTVHAIVYNPARDAYLTLKWKKFDWETIVLGGIEEGESPLEAAIREVEEETGYTDIEFKRILGAPVQASYFAAHKNENRVAITTAVYFEMKSEAQVDRSQEEKDAHDIVWKPAKAFYNERMTNSELVYWLPRLKSDKDGPYLGDGVLVQSGDFDGKENTSVMKDIVTAAGGKWVTKYKLRDWIFSRQRYWGEPIPVVHCEKCGIVPLPEKDLPLKLPKVKDFRPTESGESPLASAEKWVKTKCPQCKGKARRETDTMPNWAGSSWYYLRYVDPKNKKALADRAKLEYWTPVDWYNGGMEHTTLHLLYSRFWHKFLYDIGVVPTIEPYAKRTSHGLILAPGGEKMSKSKGNVVNPDSLIESVGADSLRLYEMFMGPFDQPIAWDTNNIAGVRRFVERVWKLREKISQTTTDSSPTSDTVLHKTIKKVTEDIEAMRFNTAISSMMILLNDLDKAVSRESYEILLQLLAPFAPHVTEELWQSLGHKESIHSTPWPVFDPKKIVESEMTIPVQVNGKVRATMSITPEMTEKEIEVKVLALPEISKFTTGATPKRIIHVKNKLVNIVI